jgi:hypothetical protein
MAAVNPLTRGKQFANYHTGQMRPIGSRVPRGGIAADAYRPYSGIDAASVEGLDLYFNHAEVSSLVPMISQC